MVKATIKQGYYLLACVDKSTGRAVNIGPVFNRLRLNMLMAECEMLNYKVIGIWRLKGGERLVEIDR